MTELRNSNFLLEVAKGSVPGHSLYHKFGRNADVDAAAPEDVWIQGGTWVAPTAPAVASLVSGSANDTSAGTGARTVEIEGLDSTWAAATETVTMNGAGAVTTSESWWRIFRTKVSTAGSTGSNVGIITATVGTVQSTIAATDGQALQAIYTVPLGKTAYLTEYYGSLLAATAAATSVNLKLFLRPDADNSDAPWQIKDVRGLYNAGNSFFYQPLVPPSLGFNEKSDIRVQAATDKNDADVSVGFGLILVDN